MKKTTAFKKLLTCFLVTGFAAFLTGCTSLSYVGEDYDAKNSSSIQTSELFTFNTYTKTSKSEDIDMKVGVSKTPLPDALVVYVNIKNNSTASDYVFYLKDFVIKAGNETLKPIPPSSYLDAYQSYETGTYAGLSNLAPTLGAIADIQNTYHNINNTVNSAAVKNASNNAVTGQISAIASGISKKTITSAGVIKCKQSDFYYIFLKDPLTLPINITYKDLSYSFGEAAKK